MDIVFSSSKQEKVFNQERALKRDYGQNAPYIMRRMAVLRAAPCLADVPETKPERRHELSGARKGQFAVDLKQPFRLTFQPNHQPSPLKTDGGIDLTRVTAIKILDVEDYH